MLGWAVYVLKFGSIKPELDATVVIGMDNNQSMSPVRDISESVQGRIDIVKGRGFLKDIVEKLSLQLFIKDYSRNQVFDSVQIDSSAIPGNFKLSIDKQQKTYQVLFTNKGLGIKNKVVDNGFLSKLDTLRLPGLYLHFSSDFLKDAENLSFSIVPLRNAIDRLRGSLNVQGAQSTRGSSNAAIVVKGRDYHLITVTANTIADEFIERNLNFRKRKTRDVIEMLKKQLTTAAQQLAESQNAVQAFRKQYPNVGLANDIMNSVNNMTQMESNVFVSQMSIKEAENIRNKLQNASVDKNLELSEALAFLQDRRIIAASVLQSEMAQLIQRQQELSVGFDKNHPFIIENRNKIASVSQKTLTLLNEYINNTTSDIQRQNNQVQGLITRMQGLPSLQLRLAELERQAQVNTQIHSEILNRYNQSKIADATEVADVFIMDYAVDPIPPSDFVNVMILLAIGFLISLTVAFAPPLLFDFFDKTVRTETELKSLLPFTVLESIPVIKTSSDSGKNNKRKSEPRTRTIDKKLITADFSPDFTNELFRSLRAKINLKLYEQPRKSILITSYGMSEGKSLVSANLAITMAQQKLTTILIDGDIRRGVQHNSFVLSKKPGLSSFLFSEDPVNRNNIDPLIQKTHIPNLSLISSGPNVPNPSELLGHPRFEQFINFLSTIYDVIIFDTPPIGLAADAAMVSSIFSASVIVVKAGTTDVIDLRKKIDEFPNLKKKIIGLVLNGALLDRKLKYYKYSSYYYNTEPVPESLPTNTRS